MQLDPYNLRLTRHDSICLSSARIPPGVVGFCHETPISSELLERQAPELATIQRLLHELRLRTGLLGTFEVVERYRRWADRFLPPLAGVTATATAAAATATTAAAATAAAANEEESREL